MPAVSEELSSVQHLLLLQGSRGSRTPSFFSDKEIKELGSEMAPPYRLCLVVFYSNKWLIDDTEETGQTGT